MRKKWLSSNLEESKAKQNKTQSLEYKSINLNILKNKKIKKQSPRVLYPEATLEKSSPNLHVAYSEPKGSLSLSERIKEIKLERRQYSERMAAFEKFLQKTANKAKKPFARNKDKLKYSIIGYKQEKPINKTDIQFSKTLIIESSNYKNTSTIFT